MFLIFFFIIGIIWGVYLMRQNVKEETVLREERFQKLFECLRHDWSYNQDNRLECLRCKKLAGLPKEYDEE